MKRSWFATRKERNLLFGALLVVIVILVVTLVGLMSGGDEPVGSDDEELGPEIDTISGEMIWNIDEEPEIGKELIMLGFYDLRNFGYMSVQYNKIIDEVKSYITGNFPECERASYREGSFKYLDDKWLIASFEFVLDNEKTFLVTLDTGGSLSDINVVIDEV